MGPEFILTAGLGGEKKQFQITENGQNVIRVGIWTYISFVH